MKLRLAIAAVILAAAVAGLVAIVSLTGDEDPAGEPTARVLSWEEEPLVLAPEDLPRDRIIYGTVRNSSLAELQAAAADFEVRDSEGKRLDATVQFLGNYAHGVYGAYQKPDPLPEEEQTRLGFRVELDTGETSPLTVSYRLEPSSELPATLYYRGSPALELPAGET